MADPGRDTLHDGHDVVVALAGFLGEVMAEKSEEVQTERCEADVLWIGRSGIGVIGSVFEGGPHPSHDQEDACGTRFVPASLLSVCVV